MTRHILFSIIAFCILQPSLHAYEFTQITTKNSELSYDGITVITQDSRGFMWIGTYKGLNRYDGISMKAYYKQDMGLDSDFIYVITEDIEGNLWIGTDHGVTIYNYVKDRFEPFTMASNQGVTIRNKVTFITTDHESNIWMLVNDQGCFSYNLKTEKLNSITYDSIGMSGFRKMYRRKEGDFFISRYHTNLYHADSSLSSITPVTSNTRPNDFYINDEIEGIFPKNDKMLYIASTNNGLSVYDIQNKTAENIFSLPKGALLHNAFFEEGVAIWLSTTMGVWRYDIGSGQATSIRHNPKDRFSISNDYTNCTFIDKDYGIWIGTKDGGINYCSAYQQYFEKQHMADSTPLQGAIVSGFAEDDYGTIWIATEEMGLLKYDPQKHSSSIYKTGGIPSRICSICHDNGRLWLGTRQGLYRLDIASGIIKDYGVLQNKGIKDPNIYTIYKSQDNLFVGTTLGLFRYNSKNDTFIEIPQFNGIFSTCILNDPERPSTMWLSSFANGVLKWDSEGSNRPVHYTREADCGITNDKIVSLYMDSESQIWSIGFSNGLYKFDRNLGKFIQHNIHHLKSEVFFKAIEDKKGSFWLSSDAGLVEYSPKTRETYIYTEKDGLLDAKFTNSALKSSSGDLYFGSDNGFIRFNPDKDSDNQGTTSIIISSMRIMDEDAHFDKNIDLIEEITLEYENNSFGFNFSIMGPYISSSDKIQCRLSGHEGGWRDIINNKSVFYYNVDSGQYTLELRISDKDGKWTEAHAPLKITVRPTFWASPAGISIIIFIISTLIILYLVYVQRKTIRKKEKEVAEFQRMKEEEIFMEKMNFFSHVIHEIKTPLTLIRTPLSNIMSKEKIDTEMHHDLEVMNNSANYLTQLVNELLDYIRSERMGFALKHEDIDIIERVRTTTLNFSDIARNSNLAIKFESELGRVIISADSSALDKIVNNIIHNAVKYAESEITIQTICKDNYIEIHFMNDGGVIPFEHREDIFKPFFQYKGNSTLQKSGVGIGLPLSKNLAKMHSGDLYMGDCEQTCFILRLPIKYVDVIEANPLEYTNVAEKSDTERILIADDNKEFREYLASKLGKDYNTTCVADGDAAYRVLQEENIDLLVSDISMPSTTGLELCEKIRKNIELSHIPIIIISARVSIESKIQAMESGADLYIEKPFDMEYLRSSIKNILDKRSLMKNAYGSGLVKTDINLFGLPKKDEDLFTKFDSIIRENLSNGDFSNEMLAAALNMSESTMLRKIKKLLNTSPNNYIKTVRLSVAAELLKDSHGNNITEICYQVGFSSVSYFAKCFKEQYGMTPSEWATRE